MEKVDLRKYDNSWYKPGNFVKKLTWYYVNIFFFKSGIFPFFSFKNSILRLFGAKIGTGCGFKPGVSIKYPWLLNVGNNVWIGEDVWIDNLAKVSIQNNVCISQGAMLLTGNHDYSKIKFDLIVGEINLEEGVWIGAKSIVCPGVTCKTHAVLTAGSVASIDLEEYSINKGNPAKKIKSRLIS